MAGDDHSKLLCPAERKAELEAANGVVLLDYLTDLVVTRKVADLRESHILEMQRITVDGIYPCAGTYRDARTTITISDSEHVPPESALVQSMVRDAVDWINTSRRDGRSALERAAYALWRFNWIHPFNGGNGRSSRGIAYLVLCMDLGNMLPGVPTLPTLIYERRDEYVQGLQAADKSLREVQAADDDIDREPDLSAMTTYLRELVMHQLAHAIDSLSAIKQ